MHRVSQVVYMRRLWRATVGRPHREPNVAPASQPKSSSVLQPPSITPLLPSPNTHDGAHHAIRPAQPLTMRFSALASGLCTLASLAGATPRTAQVYIQAIAPAGSGSSGEKPSPLAEVAYDLAALSTSSIVSYEAPDLAPETETVRIGVYDYKSKAWVSGTTVASVENFAKGYSPNIILSVDARGDVVSAACKGVAIDAGQTRDFGPQAVVLPEARGKQPELNKPVVLSPEGKKVAEEQEKSFLQKYWWMIAIAGFMVLSSGGSEK